MSLIDILGSAVSSVVGGGLTGIVGVVVQRWADYRNKKLDIEASKDRYAHEINLKRVEGEIMAHEWAARTRIADVETAGRSDVADSQAFAASFNEPQRYSADVRPNRGQSWLLVILDFIRGIVRPGLTLYLCVLTTLIYFHIREALKGDPLDQAQMAELLKLVIGTVLYLCTSCILWWFGVRNRGPQKLGGR